MINLRIVSDLNAMNQGLRRLLDQMFVGLDARVCLHGQTWSPQMDIYETPDVYIIVMELSGMKPEEVDVIVDRNIIKISGCRQQPTLSSPVHVHQMEIDYGVFERAFRLPSSIKPEEATATSEQGLLKIILPKEVHQQKKIGVTSE
ncbi:MAG: Hsp20/alpha crystallin family protein [Deltaproteobacteria bacterium]|nr:Hsp20/alpha crystallin family protein [Deltaproteobacteria bacterium]MBW2051331.1 Hsp20/alpha crystallin family protein [Deltaproteobacteria bacterium]MBW2141290.1 Hsp20/alpha crystallin family protein [Deltaproteobacteria bacterium]MBW2322799.1 Hsp20/alpha crystallin family protein [Deltaproteobacteria bacterium]